MLRSPLHKTWAEPNFPYDPLGGKDWVPVLNEGIDLLNEHGIEWQLGAGTLLGMVREEDGLIHHDTDIDIDIIVRRSESINKRSVALIDDFVERGYRLIRTQYYENRPVQIALLHEEKKIIYDLSFYYRKWGSDWCCVYDVGVYFRPEWSVRYVGRLEKFGRVYRIPDNYNRYLKGRFGHDWRTPKKEKTEQQDTAGEYLLRL